MRPQVQVTKAKNVKDSAEKWEGIGRDREQKDHSV